MHTRLIGYDLNRPGQDYDELHDAIKALGAWWHHLDSTWLVKSNLSCVEIRDRLKSHIDNGDELLVVDVSGAARAWIGFDDSGSKWLKNNV